MKQFNLTAVAAIAVQTLSIAPAMAEQHRVVFQQPIRVSVPSIPTLVRKVEMTLSSNSGWNMASANQTMRQCSLTLSFEGRDIALQNASIGEHYFGTMDLRCSGGFWHKDFTMHYSRVLFLGIRDCVQSETMVDQDYCKLQAVAYQRENDMSAARGDLLLDTPSKKRFFVAQEETTGNYLAKHHLLPDGLNPATLNSSQVFDLSLSRNGQELLVVNPGKESSFLTGSNYYFGGGEALARRDDSLVREVSTQLDSLAKVLATIRNEGASIQPASIESFLTGLTRATTRMLEVFSPAEYFRLEKRVRELEADLIVQVRSADPQVVNRETFVQKYGASFQDYLRIAAYLKNSSAAEGSGQTNEATPSTQPEVGLEFMGESKQTRRHAVQLALDQCNAYLRKDEFAKVRHDYSCNYTKDWETSLAYYSIAKVIKAQ